MLHRGLVAGLAAASALAVPAVVAGAAGSQTRLTTSPALDSRAVFSPDGSRIAFVSDRDGGEDVYVMNADGSGEARVTATGAFKSNVGWSPDGSTLVFEQGDPDPNGCCTQQEIYVVGADGSGIRPLSPWAGEDWEPEWSRDGTRIAFSSTRGSGGFDLFAVGADGTGLEQLTATPGAEQDAAWSPDGSRIAFTRSDGGGDDVFSIAADGTDEAQLTDDPASDSDPVWSPDGSRIAFLSTRTGDVEVFVMDAAGGGETNVSQRPVLDDRAAGWAPDSRRLAFTAHDDMGMPADVVVATADGADRFAVTDAPAEEFLFDGMSSGGEAWSTDGTQVLVTSTLAEPGNYDVALVVATRGATYAFEGFFSPVDNLPTLNSMTAGRGVPVKFGLGGDHGLDVFAAGSPRSAQVACDSGALVDGVDETVAAGSSSLTYDGATDRYQYVWKTSKEWAGTCRQLVLAFDDGSVQQATFLFR